MSKSGLSFTADGMYSAFKMASFFGAPGVRAGLVLSWDRAITVLYIIYKYEAVMFNVDIIPSYTSDCTISA